MDVDLWIRLVDAGVKAEYVGEVLAVFEIHGDSKTGALGGAPFDVNTKVGIALRKTDTALKTQLEKAMQAMVKDGTYAALMKKWSLPAQSAAY